MPEERYTPPPVPDSVSPDMRNYLDEQLAAIAYLLNLLLQYNEDNP